LSLYMTDIIDKLILSRFTFTLVSIQALQNTK